MRNSTGPAASAAVAPDPGASVTRRVVVSPHLDDAVFSCFAAVARADAVVTVFAGVPPDGLLGDWDAETGATSSAERVNARRAEDRAALALADAEAVHLDLLDRQHVLALGGAAASVDEVVEALRPQLEHATTVHAPTGVEHPDHRTVREAVLRLRPDATLYADIPYVLRPDASRDDLAGEHTRDRELRRERLDDRLFRRKLEACRCYASQLDELIALHGDFLSDPRLADELVWERVRPAVARDSRFPA
jgi:LmbE family N-acetylglucosaminyl deacetylase